MGRELTKTQFSKGSSFWMSSRRVLFRSRWWMFRSLQFHREGVSQRLTHRRGCLAAHLTIAKWFPKKRLAYSIPYQFRGNRNFRGDLRKSKVYEWLVYFQHKDRKIYSVNQLESDKFRSDHKRSILFHLQPAYCLSLFQRRIKKTNSSFDRIHKRSKYCQICRQLWAFRLLLNKGCR